MFSTQQNLAPTQAPPFAPRPMPLGAAKLTYVSLTDWQEFVDSHPASTAFHHRLWIETIQQQYGFDLHIPCLTSGGEILAGIPFLSTNSVLGKRKLSALPFTDCLPILCRSKEAANALAASLLADRPPCDSMTLRTDTVVENIASCSHSVRHDVTIPANPQELAKMFKPSTHRNLHKARRLGLRFVRRTDAEAVEAFYRLHLLTRRKLGVPVQPKRFFALLRRSMLEPGLGYIGLVLKSAEPIAAGLLLQFNNSVIYKYAASQPAALADRPNDWLVYSALCCACDEGYGKFDFGISDRKQDGLKRFKRNWGAKEIDVHTVQLAGKPGAPTEDSMSFRLASWVIRHTPTVVCRVTGEVLYRYAI